MLVQNVRNFVLAKAIDLHAEYILHHRTGVCINNKLIFIFGVFQISITGESSNELAILTFDRQMAPDLHRKVSAVGVVNQVFERHHNIMRRINIQTTDSVI